MFCFSFLSICCSLYSEYTFPVISVNLHSLQRSPQISSMHLNDSMSSDVTHLPVLPPQNLQQVISYLKLHSKLSCPSGLLVQLLESLPRQPSLLSPAIWPLSTVHTASLLKTSPCCVLAVGWILSYSSHTLR